MKRFKTKRTRRPQFDPWTAPEHQRLASDMERNERGELILDQRPQIMKPEKIINPLGKKTK